VIAMGTARMVVSEEREKTPLFVRASTPRTFLGLGTFVGIGLLFCGSYLLIDALASPLESNQVAVLAAAFMLALAIFLLFYLLQPMRRTALAQRSRIRKAGSEKRGTLGWILASMRRARVSNPHLLDEKRDLPGPM
jgi:hypothetical protein